MLANGRLPVIPHYQLKWGMLTGVHTPEGGSTRVEVNTTSSTMGTGRRSREERWVELQNQMHGKLMDCLVDNKRRKLWWWLSAWDLQHH